MSLEHWRYFLTLEEDLERTLRYVEPTTANMKAHSMEFARLILAACSEVEVVAKVLCREIDPTAAPDKITDYAAIILRSFPRLPETLVQAPMYGMQMHPWKEWASGVTPGWWRDHQKVKHSRHDFFSLADLEHAVVSLSGLFVLVAYLYRRELFGEQLRPKARVLRLEKESGYLVVGGNALPDFPDGKA